MGERTLVGWQRNAVANESVAPHRRRSVGEVEGEWAGNDAGKVQGQDGHSRGALDLEVVGDHAFGGAGQQMNGVQLAAEDVEGVREQRAMMKGPEHDQQVRSEVRRGPDFGRDVVGGALLDRCGHTSLYWLPLAIYAAQWVAVTWLKRVQGDALPVAVAPALPTHPHQPEAQALTQPISPKTFLQMAWLVNPFAYMGIFTLLAVIPALANDLKLSATESGLFCSIWFFARLATFIGLWRWTGWHYRFRWLLGAFLALLASLATLLLTRDYWWLVLAQLGFGVAVGLIYYSSLFYSMDVGETQGEHGGLHEAMIGSGICIGPAIGVAGLLLAPGQPHAGAFAVLAVLTGGLAGLIGLRVRGGRAKPKSRFRSPRSEG